MQKFFCDVRGQINMSDFGVDILTIFLILEYGQEHHKHNDITSGPIGPQVPSGLILEKKSL